MAAPSPPERPVAPDSTPSYRIPSASGSTALIVLAVIATLYFGEGIFVPFALAVLLSFMLAPALNWLRRLHIPRVPAVILVVMFAFTVLGGLSVLVGSQVVQLAENLPTYQQTMLEKIRSIRASAPGGGLIDRTTALLQSLRKELETGDETKQRTRPEAQRQADQPAGKEPLVVRIEPPPSKPFDVFRTVFTPLVGPLGTLGIVIVFVFFILLERHDLRDRFIRLTGGDLHRMTEALNEAASRVTRYLTMQLVINATYGLPIAIGLYLIGVPNALLWGLLAMLLRFVPYLGPFVAALFPLALAFAVDPGWSMLVWTAVLFIGMELISNNVMEPWLYGSSTGLSPVAVILSAIFWTLLWGPIGLILATPITVCLVVMGRYVPRMEWLGVLLGADPVLAPEERFYQRLLAGNVEEAIEIAEERVAESSVLEFYDRVALPALRLAEEDRERGGSMEDRKRVAGGMEAVVRELRTDGEREPAQGPVLCIAGRWELDAALAAVWAHALETVEIKAQHLPATLVSPESIANVDLTNVQIVCLSYLDPLPQAYARFVCRRLKRRRPDLRIVLGLWNYGLDTAAAERLLLAAGADAVETALAPAVKRVADILHPAPPPMVPPPMPENETERLKALASSGLLATRIDGHLDRVAARVAEAFEAPIALVSLVDESCQIWKGAYGLPSDLAGTRQGTRETSICGHVVADGSPLVVEDTARDPRFAGNPFLRERGIRFYAGAPLRAASGHVIGSLCVLDTRPRRLAPRDIKLLTIIADELMASVDNPARGGENASESVAVPSNGKDSPPSGKSEAA
jgi:predicted PurR-regulated permease PerM/GAF domain-containing protein